MKWSKLWRCNHRMEIIENPILPTTIEFDRLSSTLKLIPFHAHHLMYWAQEAKDFGVKDIRFYLRACPIIGLLLRVCVQGKVPELFQHIFVVVSSYICSCFSIYLQMFQHIFAVVSAFIDSSTCREFEARDYFGTIMHRNQRRKHTNNWIKLVSLGLSFSRQNRNPCV